LLCLGGQASKLCAHELCTHELCTHEPRVHVHALILDFLTRSFSPTLSSHPRAPSRPTLARAVSNVPTDPPAHAHALYSRRGHITFAHINSACAMQVHALPTTQEPPLDGDVCGVCLEGPVETDDGAGVPWRLLPCGHRFHTLCVDDWLCRLDGVRPCVCAGAQNVVWRACYFPGWPRALCASNCWPASYILHLTSYLSSVAQCACAWQAHARTVSVAQCACAWQAHARTSYI
jgi:hypothetical protein